MAAPPGPITVLRGHTEAVNAIKFMKDGQIVTGTIGGVMKIWSIESRREIRSVSAHMASILSIESIIAHERICSSSRDGLVKIWDKESILCETGAPVQTLTTGSIHFCNSSTDSSHIQDPFMICTPSMDETDIFLWDLRSGCIAVKMSGSPEHGMTSSLQLTTSISLRFCTPKTDSDIPAEKDQSGNVVEAEEQSASRQLKCSDFTLSSSAPHVFVGLEDGSISAYDLRRLNSPIANLGGTKNKQPLLALHLSPNGSFLCAGGADSQLRLVSIAQSPRVQTETHARTQQRAEHEDEGKEDEATTENISSAPITGDEDLSLSFDETLRAALPLAGTSGLRIRSDARIVVSAHWDGSVRIFDCKKLKPLARLKYHKESAFCVDFGPPGEHAGLFASGSKDGSVAIWDVYATTVRA